MTKRQGGNAIVGLIILFVVLIGLATYYEQVGQDKVSASTPGAGNAQKKGLRALFLLFQREGFQTATLRAPWDDLTAKDGLLIFVEPSDGDRQITQDDLEVLARWVRNGGTLLDVVSPPPIDQPIDPKNKVTGDMGAKAGPDVKHDAAVLAGSSPLVQGVTVLSVQSPQRLLLAAHKPVKILAQDESGVIAAEEPLGRGRVICLANRYGVTNEGIADGDNALLLMNIARNAAGPDKHALVFDEYHHGIGFARQTTVASGDLWSNLPAPWRLAWIHLLVLSVLILYNANRRFGPARIERPVSHRSSTDYVNSMARLYRRAGAGDIAVEILYTRFLRDLKRALDLPQDTGVPQLIRVAEEKLGVDGVGLQSLLASGEAVVAGQRLPETNMLHLAAQIEHFRRICHLVGV